MKFEHFVTWRRIIIWTFEEIWVSCDYLCFVTEHGRNSRDTESDLFYIRSISVCLLSCGLTWYMDCLRHHNHLLDHCQMRLLSSCRMSLKCFHLNKFTSANICYRVLLKTRLDPNLSFLYAEWWVVGVHVFLSIIRRPGSDIRDRHHDVTDRRSGRRSYLRNHNLR